MTIELPDALFADEKQKQQLKIELAIILFQKGFFSSGKAAEFCGMNKFDFWDLLYERNIARYTEEDWKMDLETLKWREEHDRSK